MTTSRNKGILRKITLLITIFSLSLSAHAKYSGGTGEPNDPYQIRTVTDWQNLMNTSSDWNKHFILMADIDLQGIYLLPLGTSSNKSFMGIFDGNNHIIYNAVIQKPNNYYIGLFGHVGQNGKIRNIAAINVAITGNYYVGGLVGVNFGDITDSYSTGAVNGNRDVGGLVGSNYGNITASYSTGAVNGNRDVGGLVGSNYDSINTSYSTGNVNGTGNVGGFVGMNWKGSITTSYSTGTVSGNWNVGGLVGENENAVITASFSTGTVIGDASVGGLVGHNYEGCITQSYSTGVVTGDRDVGGLIGYNLRGSINLSFWNVENSGLANMCGYQGEAMGCDNSYGKTTAEMQDINTYLNAGWDFVEEIHNGTCDYWQKSPGDYPHLHYHADNSPEMPEGLGTVEEPYLIRDARDMGTIWFEPMAHYRLAESVDLSGITWSMAVIPWFDGTFDGNDYVISNLHIQGGGYLGLFGELASGAKISHLDLDAIDVNGIGDYIGGIVGCNKYGSITASYSAGTVSGNWHVGGIVGHNYQNSFITSSSSTCAVSGNWYVGGLVGSNHQGSITTSYSTGAVTGSWNVGGLVGDNIHFGSIKRSYNTGTVSGNDRAGGLVGYNGNCVIINSYSTGTVSGGDYCTGGLVGYNDSSIINNSYSTGTVIGNSYVGGLVGGNLDGSIITSYSTSEVTGHKYVGGLVGQNSEGSSVTTSYSTGKVSGTGQRVGGLVGDNDSSITLSFWDSETSEQSTSDGGTGLTTAEMQDINTYLNAGWDFVDENLNGTCDYWRISPGDYPRLRYPEGDTPVMPEGLGTAERPYLVQDARDLGTVWLEPKAHYRLATHMDLSGITWSLAVIPWFDGTFDGNGYTIGNLHIQGGDNLGLFGQTGSGGKISTLGLEAVDVNGINDCVGGLVGYNYKANINNSYSEGIVRGDDFVGGLIGHNYEGRISTSYSKCTISGDGLIGGLVGISYGNITSSYNTGNVSGTNRVGGLTGFNCGDISMSYNTGTISGDERVGGLVGKYYDGSITSSYNTGNISGNYKVGGLIGFNDGNISTSYNTGTVSGYADIGGLVGENRENADITSSFWDIETSGLTNMCGLKADDDACCIDSFGKTTAEMQTESTFTDAGWDFIDETTNGTEDIWWIDEGVDYPRLWWEAQN